MQAHQCSARLVLPGRQELGSATLQVEILHGLKCSPKAVYIPHTLRHECPLYLQGWQGRRHSIADQDPVWSHFHPQHPVLPQPHWHLVPHTAGKCHTAGFRA